MGAYIFMLYGSCMTSEDQNKRREFFVRMRPGRVAHFVYESLEEANSCCVDAGPIIHVREIGDGLVPVEDVVPLLEALKKIEYLRFETLPKTEEWVLAHDAIATFHTKHPGVKK